MTRPFALAFLLAAIPACAQITAPTPPAPPAPPSPRRQVHIDYERHDHTSVTDIVPAGTWWRSQQIIRDLALTADQQHKMDDIFRQNRIQLIHMKASLEEEQLNLEPILNSNPPDTNKAMGEISKIADLRADLEKANAGMLLALRTQLTADQWTRLQTLHTGSPFTVTMPRFDFRFGENQNRNSTTTTCTDGRGPDHKDCTTTTVTVKTEGGRPMVTVCVQAPGQTTPKCNTHPAGGGDGSLNLMPPPEGALKMPAGFFIKPPTPDLFD